jgi:hypothetical protein
VPPSKIDYTPQLVGIVLIYDPINLAEYPRGIIGEALGDRFGDVKFMSDAMVLENALQNTVCIVQPIRLELKKENVLGLKDLTLDASAVIPKLRELLSIKAVRAVGFNFQARFRLHDVKHTAQFIVERFTSLRGIESRLGIELTGIGLRFAFRKAGVLYDFKFEPYFRDLGQFFTEINCHIDAVNDALLGDLESGLNRQRAFYESIVDDLLRQTGGQG